MNPIPNSRIKQGHPQITREATAAGKRSGKVLVNNAWKLSKDFFQYAKKDHGLFKKNAFILSSAILVIARIAISFQSAVLARNTPKADYRLTEAMGTAFRECAGFLASFATFGLFYSLTKKRLGRHLFQKQAEKTVNRTATLFKHIGQELKALWNKTQKKITGVYSENHTAKEGQYISEGMLQSKPKAIKQLVSWFKAKGKPFEKQAKDAHEWLSIGAGAIPTVLLSGFLLENFNLKHSEALFARFKKDGQQDIAAVPAKDLFAPPQLQNFHAGNFNQFMGNIYTKRLNYLSDFNQPDNPFVQLQYKQQ